MSVSVGNLTSEVKVSSSSGAAPGPGQNRQADLADARDMQATIARIAARTEESDDDD